MAVSPVATLPGLHPAVGMQEVEVEALPLEVLASILTPERARRLAESGARARAAFGDRTIWHVNATAHGGGVAEMLQTLLAYGRGAQIENRWLVLNGEPEFFSITKRLHNLCTATPATAVPSAPPSTPATNGSSTPTSPR